MIGRRKILLGALWVVVFAALFVFVGPVDVAVKSIQFDLRTIGESIYEAHARRGTWPERIADLEGTAYLRMPYRRGGLERAHFVVVWHRDLDPNPAANRSRILAYDNGSLLARLGFVWACRGDLSVERLTRSEIQAFAQRSSGR